MMRECDRCHNKFEKKTRGEKICLDCWEKAYAHRKGKPSWQNRSDLK